MELPVNTEWLNYMAKVIQPVCYRTEIQIQGRLILKFMAGAIVHSLEFVLLLQIPH